MIQALIADDHPLLRTGFRHVLERERDFSPPGEAEDSRQLMVQLEKRPWDVVVLDIAMPGRSGLEALAEIRRRWPALPVLILSVHSEEQYAIRAIKAGASGYLNKANAPAELVRAIRRVLAGKKYVSSSLAEALANAVETGDERQPHEALSDREYYVLCAIASGKSVSEIASEASLSVKTISTYRARALEKMKMRTNAELTRYAIRSGLVD